MSEIETSPGGPGSLRKCPWCREAFTPAKKWQIYCKKKCANRAQKARKRDLQAIPDTPPERCDPSRLLFELQLERDRIRVARLEVDAYLEVRAGVLEAEEQLRQWTQRLMDRRARLTGLTEPPLSRRVQLLRGDERLVVPGGTTAVGIVSTDGLVGVAIFGVPH
jgi:hypothetical protein